MRNDGGLTLLELLLVVFILSVAALSAVSLVDRTDQQVRFEDTQGRLRQIRRAILGPETDAAGPRTLWGYVADLGVLPDDIENLVRPSGAASFQAVDVEFDGTALTGLPLWKGWRGPYVTLPPSTDPSNARFRDGWGNLSATDDDLHHGWNDLDPAAAPFEVVSFGADGSTGGTGYDADVAVQLADSDWQVPLGGWTVDVLNTSGSQVDVRVSVLVYKNGSWSRETSTQDQVLHTETRTLTFSTGSVPLGRHLLIVVDASGSTETPYTPYVTRPVDFWPRTNLPGLTLEVR